MADEIIMTEEIIKTASMPTVSLQYVETLEKVNQIHGVGLTLAGVFIAILGVVMTGATIFVAFYIWRNSSEQKKEKKLREQRYEEEMDTLIKKYSEEFSKNMAILKKTYQEKLDEIVLETKGVSSGAGKDAEKAKEKLESLLKDYEQKLSSNTDVKVCSKCGVHFSSNYSHRGNLGFNLLDIDISPLAQMQNYESLLRPLCGRCSGKII